MLRRSNSGFTLVELLVVITIIAILLSIVLASVSEARKNARDKVRINEISQVEQALRQYVLQYGEFPCELVSKCTSPVQLENVSGAVSGEIGVGNYIDELLAPYMAEVPRDPLGGEYQYYYDGRHACGGQPNQAVLIVTGLEVEGLNNYSRTLEFCSSLGSEGRGSNENVYYIILGPSTDG